MKSILITGAAGMLGTAIIDVLRDNFAIIATDIEQGWSPKKVQWNIIDLLDNGELKRLLKEKRPDIVIHCAAIVNVDTCEKSPALAQALHAGSTSSIAGLINEWQGKLIYISTDSVFNGQKREPYIEQDRVDPPNIYAVTKRAGEIEALKFRNNVVLRTNIFGWSRAERTSFAEWVIKGLVLSEKLRLFADVTYTPIHVYHFANIIKQVIEKNIRGLYHAGGKSVISKYGFGIKVADIFNLSSDNIISGSVDNAGLNALRPKNMAISSQLLQNEHGISAPTVDTGIALLKEQYDTGWVSTIKGRTTKKQYRFWETSDECTD